MKPSKKVPKGKARPQLLVGGRSSVDQLTRALVNGSTPQATAALKPIFDDMALKID